MLGGSLGLAATGLLGASIASCGQDTPKPAATDMTRGKLTPNFSDTISTLPSAALLAFTSVPAILDQTFDAVAVPPGYAARPFFSWGDPVVAGAPSWQADASQTADDQQLQAGQSHDGMVYFPMKDKPDRGLLAVNHEDLEPLTLHPSGPTIDSSGLRPLAEVRKELAALGVSIIEVRKNAAGAWERVTDSPYGRRITGTTPMDITGPAAGHPSMRTLADPEGRTVLGTLNNCASGRTPWGTYLTCEENFYNVFTNKDPTDLKARREHRRMGVKTTSSYAWETVEERFNVTPRLDLPEQGYVNEVNRFGWVVEIDPFDPLSVPKKRTAMGRFSHENVACSMTEDGRMGLYMGDDARAEYIYKFVPRNQYQAGVTRGELLDEGTLYVGVFNEDGSGEWVELQHGRNGLTRVNGFKDQGDVLINTRSAADHVGATPMDRPEWVAVNPFTRDVYVTLTNNSNRGLDPDRNAINAANPRPKNLFGHIMKIVEDAADPTAKTFRWEIFVLAGDPSLEASNLQGNIKGDLFGSPDGLWFDKFGRLWIQTDFDDSTPEYTKSIGLNMMLAADPVGREIRRFLVGPKGCEITGVTSNPDSTVLFVNVQHPTLSYPASDGVTRPRSTTVLITRDDGGVIGT
jgi:secreted PhoX family phosphatase